MKKVLLSSLLLLAAIFNALAQQITVQGTVISKTDDEPLIGASVQSVADPSMGVTTDFDGNFIIKIEQGAKLKVSYIGFVAQEFTAKSEPITIYLEENSAVLDEVIVVGYSVQKKADVTGAISAVNMDDLAKQNENNPMKALQGKVPGMNISADGNPSGTSSIRIRGTGTLNNNDPLYIIDGVPTKGGMHELNPGDIESMQILKDAASASIYGSRAANGVIIITTKRGKDLKISLDASVAASFYTNKLKVLNAQQYGQAMWQAYVNSGQDPNTNALGYRYDWGYDANGYPTLYGVSMNKYLDSANTTPAADTDWFDETTRTGFIQNYNLSISGGSEKMSAFFSLGYYKNLGDVFTDYTMSVVHDNVYFTTFVIDNKYAGTIDNAARTIQVFVPLEADITSMLVSYTLNEGATAEPASSTIVDFTSPVVFTATYRTAVIEYTVTVTQDDMSQEPKAFIGYGESIEALGDEARTAAQWMMANVPNTTFVSLQNVLNGTVKLSDYKMIWCHFDWTDWPGIMWDTRDLFNDYYIKGGNILASRDGARYINDVWRIALDQQCPNNTFGGDNAETLDYDLGFSVTGHESHALYAGLPIVDGRIILVGAGCTNTNRTLQWGVDWDPYGSMQGWEEKTGAKAIGADHGGDINRCTIAEFQPREVLKGYQSGTVITIGTPAFEWHQAAGENVYRPNMEQLTKNAINYLCK